MAKILFIHGINSEHRGRRWVKDEILAPLQDGMEIGVGDHAVPGEEDVDVAFWGDLVRPPDQALSEAEPESDPPPAFAPKDLTEGTEQELLRALVDEAVQCEAITPSRKDVLTPEWVQEALYKLADSALFRGLYGNGERAMRSVIYQIKTVSSYMKDQGTFYSAVQARIDKHLGPDTRVVIGHSLGTVIAYEALCRDARGVRTFITLGSPLGVPTIIYDRLRPAWVEMPDGAKVRARPSVKHWYNICDASDFVALVKKLGPKFAPVIHDVLIESDHFERHSIKAHLTAAAVGRAIYGGLQ